MDEANEKREASELVRRREEQIQRIREAMRRDVEVFDRIVKGRRPDPKDKSKR